MHDEIIRYSLDGEMTDRNIVEEKQRLVRELQNQMRDEGVIPVYDLDPQFTMSYRPESGVFDFILTVYGIFVGKESWQYAGMTNGTKITRSTPPTRLGHS